MLTVLGLLLFTLTLLVAGDEVTCWAPDGTPADNSTTVPCDKNGIQEHGVFSSCCRLDGDPGLRDLCTSAGLCLSTADGIVRRGYCTDKTWQSPTCVNVCTDPESGGSANGTAELTPCSDGTGTYCCGHNELGCCGTDKAILIPTQVSVMDTEGPSISTAYKDATIALAVIAGVLLIAATAVITWLHQKNKAIRRELSEKVAASPAPAGPYDPPSPPFKDNSEVVPVAMSVPFEMTSNQHHQRYSELDASGMAVRSEMRSPVPPQQFENGLSSPMRSSKY
ncbi:hypothetical protein GGR50DRAFT_685485 [Xylaria sp. CBS 124048]|nr:hypothetical protein GGR50DRAFT_685485 [Xylaria sp. CBS 124048]